MNNSGHTEITCPYCGMKMHRYFNILGGAPPKVVTKNKCLLLDKDNNYKGCGKPITVVFEKDNNGVYRGKVII